MEIRYQVFISSTYADLQEERQEIMQALLELDCIPAGMELFPAANEDQWTLIRKVIDDCDYYIVIIGGRYGSLSPSGIGYTELEYRYALEKGKPVIGFLHKDPGKLAADRCEPTEDGKKKLSDFRDLVQKKMCRFWESPADLGSQVSRSLIKLIKSSPAIGWVRGDLVPNQTAALEILRLKAQIEVLESKLENVSTSAPEGSDKLQQGDDKFEIVYFFNASPDGYSFHGENYQDRIEISWNDIFASVAPKMIDDASESDYVSALERLIRNRGFPIQIAKNQFAKLQLTEFKISPDDFNTIKMTLIRLRFSFERLV